MLRTVLLAAAIGLAGCTTMSNQGAANGSANATPASADGRDCFFGRNVYGYDVTDEHHVTLRVGVNKRYLLGTDWNARDLRWTHAVALRSTTGYICTGNGLGVEVIGGEPRMHHPINSVVRLPDYTPSQPQGS